VFLLVLASTVLGAFQTDGTCSSDLDALVATGTAQIDGASCSQGVWTINGDFSYTTAGWYCYDHIVVTGDFHAQVSSQIIVGFNPDNIPGCHLDLRGQSTFEGFAQFVVVTPTDQQTYVKHQTLQPYDYITTATVHTSADSWSVNSIAWKDPNAVDPCYRTTLISRGGGISPDGLTQRVNVQMNLGDCNSPTEVSGLAGPAQAIPVPSVLVPYAYVSGSGSGAPTGAPTGGGGGGGGPTTDIPPGAIAGIIVMAFLIVIIVVATIVFAVIKSAAKPDKF